MTDSSLSYDLKPRGKQQGRVAVTVELGAANTIQLFALETALTDALGQGSISLA